MTSRDHLLTPMEFRFTEPRDTEKYGNGWRLYDELAIVTCPARVLLPLELEMGVSISTVMEGMRQDSVLGDTGAAWLALHFNGEHVPWADFDPCIMLAEWRQAESGKLPAEESAPTSTDTAPTDTVSLPTMPAVESPA
jgi:hypothetical protein